ncbi:CLUMA_CG012113, isoform A [Clunio marinus]|uniref:CLUMA_CG012113, isoform A n=1 Tax=Clunio marinus TaxID=568069 RepID=A0A1J1IFN3_9DIPT|nr:CLUMA_CG012113, isoform A [Clunio marinus]
MEVRAALVGSGNMISLCTCLTQLDQNFVQTFGVFLLDHILLIVLRYLSDEPTVRKSANSTLLYLIENGFLDKKVIKRTVCPVILELLRVDRLESVRELSSGENDIHLNAIGVMAKVAPIIGTEMAHETFFEKFMELSQVEMISVRKHCATIFPVMCEVLGCDLLESSMLPVYVKLCNDTSWNIRNSCAQNIQMVSILCSLQLRRKFLVPIMKKFMFDESRWVVTSALNSLGEFLATFAQPPIIGLAYNYRLELFITNAADIDFRQQYHSNMLLFSNQPNSAMILRNLEYYEREFEKELIVGMSGNAIEGQKSMRSLSVPNTTSVKLSPMNDATGTKKVNIETYLLSIIKANHFNDRMNTSGGRLSSTTASESDECELFSIQNPANPVTLMKRLSSTTDDLNNDSSSNDDNNNDDDPFNKFMKFNTPFKNNFINRILTPDTVESTFVWHMGFGESGENDGVLHNYDDIFKENGSVEQEDDDEDEDDDITDFDNNLNKNIMSYNSDESSEKNVGNDDSSSIEKKLNNLTLRDKLNNNNVDGSSSGSDDVELEKFNSHQYWYIEPPTLDDLIDQNELNNNNSKKDNDRSVENETNFNDGAGDVDAVADQSTLVMEDDVETESNDSMKIMKSESRNPQLTLNLEMPPEEGDESIRENNDSAEVEWNLIEDFVFMKDIDNNLCYKCAYNFPAVMLTLGKQFWPLLHQHFLSLCNDLQSNVRVRKTMAKSIYQIALIIGSEQATKDLVAPFVEFFKDIDDIKIEVAKHVTNFIRIIDPSKHEIIVNQLEMCWHPTVHVVNWRLREQIGIQIVELNKLGPRIQKENCLLYLTGLSLKLMMDKYDCVRKIGIDAFVSCVERIKQKKQLLKFLSFHFANSTRWRERQIYILTVDKLLEHRAIKPEMFNNYILKKLLELAVDKIPNIRLCIAKCLSYTLMENPYYNNEFRDSKKHILQQIATLEKDPDRGVRNNIFSAFSEKEKTESPSSDEFSYGLPAAPPTSSQIELVETPPPPPPPIDDVVNDQLTDSQT